MSITSLILRKVGLQRIPTVTRRIQKRYAGGQVDRLTDDWNPAAQSPDDAIRNNLRTLINRSRELGRNNDYARRYLSALTNNVLGADGINLQMKIYRENGMIDKIANDKFEEAWMEWGKASNCSLNMEDDWCEIQRLVLRTAAEDGGIFIRVLEGIDNEFKFALELIDYDHLDMTYTALSENGNRIFMGVEKNQSNQVVAYHMYRGNPNSFLDKRRYDRIRIPANEIIHYFHKERVNQSIGVPAFVSAMTRMHFLNSYEHSEAKAAARGARHGGWIESTGEMQWGGDEIQENVDENGNKTETEIIHSEDQAYTELPAGKTFKPYDPQHPNAAFEPFVRATLYGISAGLDIDYQTITGDLSQANYSSMRSGKLESQESWKWKQGHLIRKVIRPIFDRWQSMVLATNKVNLPLSKYKQFNKPQFRGRRWPWVDPQKDIAASRDAIEAQLRTRTEILAENGQDYEEVIDQIKIENDYAAEVGVELWPRPEPEPAEPEEPIEEDEEDHEDTEEELENNG